MTTPVPPAPAPGPPPAPPVSPPVPPPPAPVPQPEDGNVGDLPEWAQRRMAALTAEAAKTRVTAKQNAADEARAQLAQEIGRALGLVDGQPDPATLTEQLTAQQESARQARLTLAIYQAAATHGADPAALLDSRAFLDSAAGLDPAAADFGTQIGAAIAAAVAANPRLAAVTAPATPVTFDQGPRGSGGSGASTVSSGRDLWEQRHKRKT
jgi:hypothetical protein